MKWIAVTPIENIPPREGRSVQLGSLNVAVFNTGARFLALENRCPHRGGPLADGIVGGEVVTCPMHNWRICLDSGAVSRPCDTSAPAVRTFPVIEREGMLMLCLDEGQAAA
ncbi:MAG: nitrite reductase small subunit NirD [Bryobacteraceae bacterium]|nr:nitrite reductase small subunit NirD [Bryobacteraceae bacterium]